MYKINFLFFGHFKHVFGSYVSWKPYGRSGSVVDGDYENEADIGIKVSWIIVGARFEKLINRNRVFRETMLSIMNCTQAHGYDKHSEMNMTPRIAYQV